MEENRFGWNSTKIKIKIPNEIITNYREKYFCNVQLKAFGSLCLSDFSFVLWRYSASSATANQTEFYVFPFRHNDENVFNCLICLMPSVTHFYIRIHNARNIWNRHINESSLLNGDQNARKNRFISQPSTKSLDFKGKFCVP